MAIKLTILLDCHLNILPDKLALKMRFNCESKLKFPEIL